jgi:conjugative relaxase-like TrwC/TraI family protein
MVSISKAMTVENAGHYYKAHLSTTGEYYAPPDATTIGHALGKGAEALSLKGDITAEQFNALLRGYDPHSNACLRTRATQAEATERAGFDITLSPPKSISIQALVAGDSRLIEADRQAASYAIAQAEQCAGARQGKDREWVQTSNVCAVMFEHYDARESITSQHGPMPQLHHHVFITNLTQRPDGHWRALSEDQIYKARPFLDAVYMGELARNVQGLGYRIVRGSDGSFELEGFTREQVEAFSERYLDIEREKAKEGITNPVAARNIVLETRKAKHEHDPEALKAEREALAKEHGIDLSYRPTAPVQTFTISPQVQAQRSLDFAIADKTNRSAVPDHRELITAALKHGVGATDLDHVQKQIATYQQANRLISGGQSHSHPLGRHTTPEMAHLEAENLTLVRNKMAQGRPIVGITIRSAVDGTLRTIGTDQARDWLAARTLLPDQAEAAFLTLTTPYWASAIEGAAGTGKTAVVGTIKEFAAQRGWTVRGFGMTTGSRDELINVGIEARTIAKALASPLPPKAGHELWIVDESSLLATRPVNQLLKLARERGVERIVFVGDQRQHLAIEAGSPVQQFLADSIALARLTAIRRQQDPELKRAVELLYDQRIGEAVALLIAQNRVVEVADQKQRYEQIAAEYLNAREAGQNCLIVSPGNDERNAINQAVRAKLVEHQFVNSIGQAHQILIPHDMTDAQRQHALSYHEGDVLQFRRGSKKQGIPKGYLTVDALKDNTLTLQAENGRLIEFNPQSLKGFQIYTTETRTIAVGDRLQWREPDPKRRIANGQYATIQKLDDRNITVKFDRTNRVVSMPLSEARKVDLGYASTSHSAQGKTVERCIVQIDPARGAELVNERLAYVGASRPRGELRIYTTDIQKMQRAVSRKQEKELALDVVQQRQSQPIGMRI